jgi:hypothetical protein
MTPMLETQLTVDDIAEFQRFLGTSRPSGRQSVRTLRLVYLSLLALVGGVAATLVPKTPMGWFLLAFVFAAMVLTWFQAPKSLVRGARYRTLKTYPSGVLPPARHWLDEQGLNSDTGGVRVHNSWGVIREVEETPTHVLIWVSEIQAIILPRRNGEQQVWAFVEALRAAMGRNGLSQQPGYGYVDPRWT